MARTLEHVQLTILLNVRKAALDAAYHSIDHDNNCTALSGLHPLSPNFCRFAPRPSPDDHDRRYDFSYYDQWQRRRWYREPQQSRRHNKQGRHSHYLQPQQSPFADWLSQIRNIVPWCC